MGNEKSIGASEDDWIPAFAGMAGEQLGISGEKAGISTEEIIFLRYPEQSEASSLLFIS